MNDRYWLPTSSQNDLARRIRDVLEVGEDDKMLVRFPTFARPIDLPPPAEAPANLLAFCHLYTLKTSELLLLGMGNWDGGLFLFPAEWFDSVPEGFPVENIFGKQIAWTKSLSKDQRFGCLSYGIRIGPNTAQG